MDNFKSNRQAAQDLLTNLAAALVAKGFTTEVTVTGRLKVAEPSVGSLATLSTDRVRYNNGPLDNRWLVGEVVYEPRFGHRDSSFRLNRDEVPSLSSIISRLRKDVVVVKQRLAASRAAAARNARDEKVLEALPVVDGAQVSVWDGQVSLKLHNLTASQAKAILVLLAERQAELAQAAEVENDRDTLHVR